MLTYLRGAKLAYVDDPEIPFGSGQRSFRSFHQAAGEAATSRFYGDIRYLESCTRGVAQGQQAGRFVVAHLRSAGLQPVVAPARQHLVGTSAAPRPQKAR